MAIYTGGMKAKGEKGVKLRKLAAEIKRQQEKFAKSAGWMNIIDKGTDLLKLIPGIGNLADFGIDEFARHQLAKKTGDAGAIRALEDAYTGTGYADEFESMQDEFEGSTLLRGIEAGGEYLGSKEGASFLDSIFKDGGQVPKYKKGGMQGDIINQLEERGITLKDFTDLYTKQWGDATGESYEQMKAYYDPKTYAEWEDNPEVQEALMSRASEYMGELQRYLDTRKSGEDIPTRDYAIKESEKEAGLMALLQRLIPGGKTGMKEYAGGGSVQGGVPSISKYFEMQGKTLGGNDIQSLSEKMGRK